MSSVSFLSFAKINWTLEVLGRRSDGYHELRTILQTISLHDTLTFTLTDRAAIEIICEVPDVPTDERNLVHRAASLLAEYGGLRPRLRIELKKNIPAAGGLGGGSGNAATALLALQQLWDLKLPPRDLFALASRLGADVPCFLLGGTMIGIGRGDEIYPLPDIEARHILLVNAGIAMPTAEVYGSLPPELTKPLPISILPFSFEAAYRSVASPRDHHTSSGHFPVSQWLRNDLEQAVYLKHPLLSEIRDCLKSAGASGAMMSGSGSTIFAIFDSETLLVAAETQLQKMAQPAARWWTARARTLGRDEYLSYFSARISD
jgi:4-diphosphocytidyl-2-C-methyl-D-erythritol kinase